MGEEVLVPGRDEGEHRGGGDARHCKRDGNAEEGAKPRAAIDQGRTFKLGGRLLVADRENERVQIFDQDGELLEVWPVGGQAGVLLYVDADDVV